MRLKPSSDDKAVRRMGGTVVLLLVVFVAALVVNGAPKSPEGRKFFHLDFFSSK